MICKNNSYSWQTAILSSPETQGWPLSYFHGSPIPWVVPESVGEYVFPAKALPPRNSPTYRTNLFPLAIKLCFVIGFLEAPGFPPFRHLDAILECSSEGKKRGVEGRRHQRLQRSSKVFPEDLWAENWFRNVSARLCPLRPLTTPHPSPHSWLYLVPRLTWAKPPCCSYTRYIPPGCQSPNGLKDLSCYPVAGQNGGGGVGGVGREGRVVSGNEILALD